MIIIIKRINLKLKQLYKNFIYIIIKKKFVLNNYIYKCYKILLLIFIQIKHKKNILNLNQISQMLKYFIILPTVLTFIINILKRKINILLLQYIIKNYFYRN